MMSADPREIQRKIEEITGRLKSVRLARALADRGELEQALHILLNDPENRSDRLRRVVEWLLDDIEGQH